VKVADLPLLIRQTSAVMSHRGTVTLMVQCRTRREACKGSVTLEDKSAVRASAKRSRKQVIGRARYSARAGRTAKVKVRLSRNGRRRVLRKRRIRCRVSATTKRRNGGRTTVRRDITVKAPRKPR
jgi:hypothetical protein